MAWDMWIECTMNKGNKMKYGWLFILQNEKQLLVHSRIVNNVAKIWAVHNALANRKPAKRKHAECGPKRMREDEQCVHDLVACMHELDSFPFDPISPILRKLRSAMPASDELNADFNSDLASGEEKLTLFSVRLPPYIYQSLWANDWRFLKGQKLPSPLGISRQHLWRWSGMHSRQWLT